VSFAVDGAGFVDLVAASGDHFGVERHVAVGKADAIED
jgi:hypothetical protein